MINKIENGLVFTLPLAENKYGLGLIIRHNKHEILTYYYDVIFDKIPENIDLNIIKEHKIVYKSITLNNGFDDGDWKVLGKYPDWDKKDWPIPIFNGYNQLKIIYDDDLNREPTNIRIRSEDDLEYPKDGTEGYIHAEFVVSKRLGLNVPDDYGKDKIKNHQPLLPYFPFSFQKLDDQYLISVDLSINQIFEKFSHFFSDEGYYPNGYCWEGHIIQILEKVKPKLLEKIDFDSEGSTFNALVDDEKSAVSLIKTLYGIFKKPEKLISFIQTADRDRVDA